MSLLQIQQQDLKRTNQILYESLNFLNQIVLVQEGSMGDLYFLCVYQFT
ncbi:hypothetical protein NTG1052_350040 [Candidatus Nitrotoga sp. 1052]|nr:hypothetical protein NTG1052_350040 [Candidatus Nitrotoga sp. 1052]